MPFSATLDVRITDSCLRDGSHAVRHQLTEQNIRDVVTALDGAGVPVLEVAHGDGLAGSSFTYGFSAVDELKLIATAVDAARETKIAALLIPGIGTSELIHRVADLGVSLVRVATHCTEADVGIQHLQLARELGLDTVGFLMMSHSQPGEVLAAQARIMVDAGAQCVYVVDSAGALIPSATAERIAAVAREVGDDAQVGFHGHENLAAGIANSLAAIEAGAVQIDGSTRRMGAGAGNTPTEALAAVLEKAGLSTGIDVAAIANAAEDVVRPIMSGECVLDRMALAMGYAGVYSSFLKHAQRAATTYGVSGTAILTECGRRGLIGGQEDLIAEIAYELQQGAVPV